MKIIHADNVEKKWLPDKKGYFKIKLDRANKEIMIGLWDYKHELQQVYAGKHPLDIMYLLHNLGLVSSLYHATYLGIELEKAYTALKLGIDYVQDSDLDFSGVKK